MRAQIVEHESTAPRPVPVLRKNVQDEQEFNHAHEVRLRSDEFRVSHLLGHVREEC